MLKVQLADRHIFHTEIEIDSIPSRHLEYVHSLHGYLTFNPDNDLPMIMNRKRISKISPDMIIFHRHYYLIFIKSYVLKGNEMFIYRHLLLLSEIHRRRTHACRIVYHASNCFQRNKFNCEKERKKKRERDEFGHPFLFLLSNESV